ncbi:hypothetical protein Dsin_002322 [Dipteronia sinensis]|uniref:Uncharacterized protein n=1 Tax=Dipteronia sinensis TaxID=43782 RepID=A0AAE0B5J6_9ROSI|nr:hypothetical protein Dsin_002322 [Dipteronia sinensis]
MLTHIPDFSKFTHCPEAREYISSILRMATQSFSVAPAKSRLSSVKNICEIIGSDLPHLKPSYCPRCTGLLIKLDKPSATRYKYGDKGPPCRKPRVGITFPHTLPFTKKEKFPVEIQAITLSTHLLEKPNFAITLARKPQSTLSYAFDISSFTAIDPPLRLPVRRAWIHSKPIIALSVIDLPGMNALCDSEMTSPSTRRSLFAITFDIILYNTLHRLIGL